MFRSLKHISDKLRLAHEYSELRPIVLIFEVMAENTSAAAIAGRCQDETNLFPEAYVVVHDAIPYDDLVKGYCSIPYELRYNVACAIAKRMQFQHSEWAVVHNESEARSYAEAIINGGGEGAVFKQPQGTWTAGKKNEVMMKIKQELSYDLEVTGVAIGDSAGKYANTLGTLLCRFRRFGKPDGEVVTVSCSGMSDAERDAWWRQPSLIVGKIVQVDAMRFTEFGMLREPRFKGIRFDKEQADIV